MGVRKKIFYSRDGMNFRMIGWRLVAAMSAVLAAQAHPGHAPFSEGTKHFVTSPAHIGVVLLFSAAVCAAAQLLKGRGQRAVVRAVAALIAIAAVLF